MKEATSQLSSVLIAVSSVAIFIAFFFYEVWPMIDKNYKSQTSCDKAVCSSKPNESGMVTCTYEDKTFECPFKG